MSEIKRYNAYQIRITYRNADDSYVRAPEHDAIVADKDKIIADLKRQLEDARDNALESAALICDQDNGGWLDEAAKEIRALKSNQK